MIYLHLLYILLVFLLTLILIKRYNISSFLFLLLSSISFFILIIIVINNRLNNIFYILDILLIPFFVLIIIVDLKELWIPDLSIIIILIIKLIEFALSLLYRYNTSFYGLLFIIMMCIIILCISVLKRQYMFGFGDIKLLIVLSINITFIKVITLLLIASFLGILTFILLYITRIKKTKNSSFIPFGPLIIIAYFIVYYLF